MANMEVSDIVTHGAALMQPGETKSTRPIRRIAVGIATSGRPAILHQTLELLARQSRPADEILVCPAKPADIGAETSVAFPSLRVVRSEPGLPAQRNAILAASDADVLAFFDDDFFAHPGYLAEVEALFHTHPDIVMATGTVIADGILGPGLSPADGHRLLAAATAPAAERIDDVHNGYGCNMSVRMAPVREASLVFDETLPLYGWLEDLDFSRRLAPSGRIVRSTRLLGVHLGNKSGRSSGVRLGYSQVANPLYMVRKGTLARGRAFRQIGRNLAANIVRTLKPEPWVDRRGRLVGNLKGVADALSGQIDPRRILKL